MDTFFAPVQRTERRKFKNQIASVTASPIMNALLRTAAGVLVVLNQDRQIVAVNHAFLENLGIKDPETVLGLRLGESLKCVHAFEKPAGCGTTEFCPSCGAAIAMMAAINEDRCEDKICALVSDMNGTATDICLKIHAEPIEADGERWILIYARDITREQFLINLDRVFFHDINNTLTALYGNIQIFELNNQDRGSVKPVRESVERLINEVAVQKQISFQKTADYTPALKMVAMKTVKRDLAALIRGHEALREKKIDEDWGDENLEFESNSLLVSRILGNMVINALEATDTGGLIKIRVRLTPHAITWTVWNSAMIPQVIQKRIFLRHFSTKKGAGRGFGTYSMKLFGETYLGGKVSFTSLPDQGTTFRFRLPIS